MIDNLGYHLSSQSLLFYHSGVVDKRYTAFKHFLSEKEILEYIPQLHFLDSTCN